jgi:SAM-dependent methyltransferase
VTVKLHVGSGTVYLKGYVNVDVPSPRVHLAADRPDLVARYATAEISYYARHTEHKAIQDFREGPRFDEYVCDRYGAWDHLPCPDGSATEVLSRQVFEHLSATEAQRALLEARRVLAPGGALRLSVPDHEGTLALFIETHNPLYVRHLLGPRRDEFGYHLRSYTHAGLRALVEAHGFEFVNDELNLHAYPAICCAWRRPEAT